MTAEQSLARYRAWYAQLLRLYPRPYRERFSEGMQQTFNDLCRERAAAGEALKPVALGMFIETSAGILKERARSIAMHEKNILRVALVTGCILLVPLLGNLFLGWNWPAIAFPFWAAVLFGIGLSYELVASRGGSTAYRAAVGIACVTAFVLLWVNAAVGIIGDGPVNLLYLGVIAIGFGGALVARFRAQGMSFALFATAIAQMAVPLIALVLWQSGWVGLLTDDNSPHPPFDPGIGPVFVLNAVFALVWVGSALLFRYAAAHAMASPSR